MLCLWQPVPQHFSKVVIILGSFLSLTDGNPGWRCVGVHNLTSVNGLERALKKEYFELLKCKAKYCIETVVLFNKNVYHRFEMIESNFGFRSPHKDEIFAGVAMNSGKEGYEGLCDIYTEGTM